MRHCFGWEQKDTWCFGGLGTSRIFLHFTFPPKRKLERTKKAVQANGLDCSFEIMDDDAKKV